MMVYCDSDVFLICSRTVLFVDSAISGIGRPFTSAHALSQRRHPMHRVVSTRMPLNSFIAGPSLARVLPGVRRFPDAAPATPDPKIFRKFLLSILAPLYSLTFFLV